MSANILPTSEHPNPNSPSVSPSKLLTTTEEMSSIARVDRNYDRQEPDYEKSRHQEFWGTLENTTIDVSSHTSSQNLYSPTNRLSPYYCDVCKAEMTGPEPFKQHMSGSSHARQVKRQNLENSLTEVGGARREENVLQSSSVVQPVSPSPNYHCATCNTTMSGIEPYQQHMRGIQHLKKQRKILLEKDMLRSQSPVTPVRQESVTLGSQSPLQPNVIAQPVIPQYYCSVCNISMSGIEPYQQHIKGAPHLKREKNKELLEIHTRAQQEQAVTNSEYYCTLCKKTMSGYEPYLSHMSGIQHAKELNRQRLMETQINHPQPVLQNAPVASPSMPEIPLSCRQGLKCDTCAKRFSGIESLQDHFRSLKHQKKVQQQMDMDTSIESSRPNPPTDDVSALAERVRSGLQISNEGAGVQQPMSTSSDDLLRTCSVNQDIHTSINSFI